MKISILFVLFAFLFSCASKEKLPEGTRGCFLLYNLKTKAFEKKVGEACQERFPACSTFKVPLAVMAFDSGVLKNETQVLKWDGQKRMLEAWNKDQDARSWMKESVVWFSQRLTPELGKKKLQHYLDTFHYGNRDISTGITTAWLNAPNDHRGSLGITAYEQIDFMKKLWTDQLPASPRSMELARKITYLETSPGGFELSGKAGSNFYDSGRKVQFGWFIGHVRKGNREYLTAANISDLKPVETDKFGGFRAKEFTKQMLKKLNLW